MTLDIPPITTYAQFFDDIRIEFTGKSILIGQYVGTMFLPTGSLPVDRLSVLLVAKWPRDFMPTQFGVRVEVPGQQPLTQALLIPGPVDFSNKPVSAFSGIATQGIIQLRFPPLRSGDIIDVWLEADGHSIPAGRLYVSDQATPAASLFGSAAGGPTFVT